MRTADFFLGLVFHFSPTTFHFLYIKRLSSCLVSTSSGPHFLASFFFSRFFTHRGGTAIMWFAAITANSDPTRGGTHDDVRRRATAAQHHPSTSSMGEGGEVAEACSGVHVDGHATVANAAVIPRGFVGRQSVTDFSVVQDALPAARLAQTHAHTHTCTHAAAPHRSAL